MTQMDVQLVTTHEFDTLVQLPENRERLLELVHGEVIEKVPTETHGKLAALIAHFLLAYTLPRRIQAHVGVEVRHQMPDDRHNSRLPDVSLRLSEAPAVAAGVVAQMPDLAVEIQSSNDRRHHLREKALYQLKNGSQYVWLVYPGARQIEVCTLDTASNLVIETVGKDGMLTGADLLPAFSLALTTLFDAL